MNQGNYLDGSDMHKPSDKLINQKSSESMIKLKILIAEDNESLRIILGEIVKKYSTEVLFASNGIEAVAIMKNNSDIDLILMDFFMPEMNGREAIKQIRSFNNDVIIFVETSDNLSDIAAEFEDAGINDFFPKPYNTHLLQQLLTKHFV